ncbi:MAG TPA: RimK family alpha-L-glutamate ligase, partial [Kiloniellales bacterium]|nr:RimK family alpha-L-glutamate ligase [Kiloniellales bacterium]
LDNHTYRFARKAQREGLAVMDDPTSILRCTNKVYLAELLQANNLPAPRTLIADRQNLLEAEQLFGYPVVLKIPDGSFSRGVVKAEKRSELIELSRKLFQRSDVILVQQYMFTEFDWRVGVLNRQPLFVSQYFMSRKHWQIVKHGNDGKFVEGNFKTIAVEDAPKEVVDLGLRAAGLIGDGLYGVDIKQNADGAFVIEINDNPNLDRGVEDQVLKDELYRIVLKDFIRRIEAR